MLEPDFYAVNGARGYPLDDAASAVSDAGVPLSPDLLVDCALRFPADLGAFAFVAAVAAAPGLVTVAIEACPRPAAPSLLAGAAPTPAFRPLGTIAVRGRPPIHVPIPIDPDDPRVAGWIVLGPGALAPWTGTFAGPEGGGLLPRCARAVPAPGVTSIRVGRAVAGLTGRATLAAGSDVVVVPGRRFVVGVERDVLEVGLAVPTPTVLAAYAGPCGARPESRTCDPPAVESLGGAVPDASGNVEIVFAGTLAATTAHPLVGTVGGLLFDLPRTVADVCPPRAAAKADAAATEAAAGAVGCDAAWAFPTDEARFDADLLAGTFVVAAYGLAPLTLPLAVALPAPVPPRRLRAAFRIAATATAPGDGRDGGVVFDYAPGPPVFYRTATYDPIAATLTVARWEAGVATVEATATGAAIAGLDRMGEAATVEVSFQAATTPRTVRVAAADGMQAVTTSLEVDPPAGGGGYGLATGAGGVSFLTLEARPD